MGAGKATVLDRLISEEDGVAVLDGGLASELESRGADLTDALWSAKCLIENPGLIRQVHLDYFRAGADIVTSCSYQATFEGFQKKGLGEKQAEELMRLSVKLACEARDQANKESQSSGSPALRQKKRLVAASLGCYGASLSNGAEYSGDYGGVSTEDMMEFHRRRLRVMSRSGADVLAFETVPRLQEAEAIARLLDEDSDEDCVPAWVCFSCKDERHVSHGETLADCVRALESCKRVAAVGINCTWPRFIQGLVTEARKVTSKPIVVYPNLGESWDAERKEWVLSTGATDDDFVSMVPVWKDAGARIIGGCCRTTPRTIQCIALALKRSGQCFSASHGA
ncbi:homocysteine s-methyltransferase [Klebsormidium nitens]|uniref:Homocysteine s-methyltransferase n=1 Tax=Klebsormidium nitens TaxID=105231 RepID=A0A1Y1I3P2_KLENI|nr:homocysteine s-methyltransferase [Klebsormidium nitens]|eukprot:GAQ85554.1 homocysteine s-methyltransferase [Klebsormidium nitens]